MIVEFIDRHQGVYGVEPICAQLRELGCGFAPSSYYEARSRPESKRSEMRELDPVVPVLVGGDLNLGSGDSAYVSSCLPAASALVDDGGVQLVVATPEFVVGGSERIDLRGTTDHPGLLVTLAPRARY